MVSCLDIARRTDDEQTFSSKLTHFHLRGLNHEVDGRHNKMKDWDDSKTKGNVRKEYSQGSKEEWGRLHDCRCLITRELVGDAPA